MDNNVAKNRFFSRSIQLDLILAQISLKQVILKQLRDTIALYRTDNSIDNNLEQVLTSLPDKVILPDNSELPSLVYCCAIAFPLANLWGLPSLQVAQELVSLLTINIQESTADFSLQFTIRAIKNGLIEFVLSDRYVGLWLSGIWEWGLGEQERLREQGEQGERGSPKGLAPLRSASRGEGEIGDYNIFPVQYVHNRCCSLLRLGEREGLISLQDGDFPKDTWQITNPTPFKYYCDENIDYCYESAELNLFRKISLFIDYLGDRTKNESRQECNSQDFPTLVQLALNLSDACLKLIAACRIFGSVAQEKRDLAIARLGLIAIVQKCLQVLMMKN